MTYIGSCLAIAGGFYALFSRAEEVVAKDTRDKIAKSIKGFNPGVPKSDWKETFAYVFDSIFTNKHLSWKCFLRSCISSLIAVVVLSLVWLWIDQEGYNSYMKNQREDPNWYFIFLLPLILNILPDYISLFQTRYILKRMQGTPRTLIFLGIDACLTFLIASLAFFNIFWINLLYESFWKGEIAWYILKEFRDYFPEVLGFYTNEVTTPICIFFYSTFFTSVWIWFYILGLGIIRILYGFAFFVNFLQNTLNIEERPLRSIGFVTMVIVILGYLIAAPFVLF
ncbi:MAG: hypothetical protein ACUZ77_09835 [Candidatus Brocadiales bacterium]